MKILQILITLALLAGVWRLRKRKPEENIGISGVYSWLFFTVYFAWLFFRQCNVGLLSWIMMYSSLLYLLIFYLHAIPIAAKSKKIRLCAVCSVVLIAIIMSLYGYFLFIKKYA